MQAELDPSLTNSRRGFSGGTASIRFGRAFVGFELFSFLVILTGCGAQAEEDHLAVSACEIPPAVVNDGVGQALARGVVVPDELALWDAGGTSAGLAAIGPEGLGVLRANSACTITGREATEDGLRITLDRSEPDLDQQAAFTLQEVQDLSTITRPVSLTVVETTAGPRVRLGLAQAQAALAEARDLAERGRHDDAQAAVDALAAWFPDPLLRWERDALQAPLPVEAPAPLLPPDTPPAP